MEIAAASGKAQAAAGLPRPLRRLALRKVSRLLGRIVELVLLEIEPRVVRDLDDEQRIAVLEAWARASARARVPARA
jgi:alkylhydroperoxidase family enzyme